jgi:trk system potassium uptake protein TrkH
MAEPPRPPPERLVIRQSGQLVRGRRAGDQHLRLARRPASQQIAVPDRVARRRAWHPAVVFVYGFVGLILAGTVGLSLPVASANGQWTPLLDALFTATSAVCLTGLVVVDTGTYWSAVGHVVILALMQLGGFGFMTSSTLLLLLIGHRVSLRERVLLREALGGGGLGSVLTLARRVLVFTLICETLGIVLLSARFAAEMDPLQALWWGVFHSVSAFNNAGFDLVGGYRSLIPYSHDPLVLLTTSTLFVVGATSYTAMEDLVKERRFVHLTLDTKLVVVTMAGLLVAGTLALLFTERANPETLGGMEPGARLLNAYFQAATRTAGFSSVDIGKLTDDGLLVMIGLMFVGGASASTAGGIKVQTFSVLLFAILSVSRGQEEVVAFRRRVPTAQVLRALAVALLAVALVFLMTFSLNLTERFATLRVAFEAVSAAATVGLSTGITPDTTPAGRVILIVAMFFGRLGPLTLALALAARERHAPYHWPEETIKIG